MHMIMHWHALTRTYSSSEDSHLVVFEFERDMFRVARDWILCATCRKNTEDNRDYR